MRNADKNAKFGTTKTSRVGRGFARGSVVILTA